jgi:eukaryotic-like serine/threonine-protein kinase
MSALVSPAAKGVQNAPSTTFRALIEARRSQGARISLEDAIAIIVPVCVDLKARHDRGERHYVHPAAIMAGPDGLMRLHPQLAVPPKDPRDRAALAPEVIKSGQPGDGRASVFSVGAMLYEALTGATVGPGMRRPRDLDPSMPEALEHLLAKALVGDPSHRPDDLGALASAMHHIAPMKTIPPPDADVSSLDRGHDGQEVDVKLSLLPPQVAPGTPAPPVSVPGMPVSGAPAVKDPTRQLASLKARLESDPRPRYVVNKNRMDHGPFSAVELLQQIASHQFTAKDILRDELTGVSKSIEEWDEFGPFAEHARMHRDIAKEKREVTQAERAEKTAGTAKWIFGGVLAIAILAVLVLFVIKKVGSRKDAGDFSDDPSAVDLSGGGSLKGGKKAAAAGGGKGGPGGGGGAFPAGMSYEQALATNKQEIDMGGGKGGPDLTDAQLSAPMKNASFISGCGAPESMKVTVRVAVKGGRAVGVSVYPNPPNPQVASCIDRHVRGLGWPANSKMDSFTTTY